MYEVYERLLKERGVTTAEVCRATGISQSTISNWKKRRNMLSTKNAQLVAGFFHVSVDYLCGFTSDPADYDDGDVLAEIPQAYVEAAGGDMAKARKIMLAAEHDAAGSGVREYYLDPRTAEIAQEIADRKELGGFFDTVRDATPEDLMTLQTMFEALKRKERGE